MDDPGGRQGNESVAVRLRIYFVEALRLALISLINWSESAQMHRLFPILSQYPAQKKSLSYVRYEVFKAVTMKNTVFWDFTPCGSCKNRRFGGM
jgi:hypothetical protein